MQFIDGMEIEHIKLEFGNSNIVVYNVYNMSV